MLKDEIFKKDPYPDKFVFDKKTARVFDNMLSRSIPYYQEVMEASQIFIADNLTKNDKIYDLGCSTGNFLISLLNSPHKTIQQKIKQVDLIGIDNSAAMIEKALGKITQLVSPPPIQFICEDINKTTMEKCAAVTMHYTLQFIPPSSRILLLKKIYTNLKKNGRFVLSEKINESGKILNHHFQENYFNFKKKNNYSQLEIARKKDSLEKILITQKAESYISQLKKVGFQEISIAFKWYNFITYFAIK